MNDCKILNAERFGSELIVKRFYMNSGEAYKNFKVYGYMVKKKPPLGLNNVRN